MTVLRRMLPCEKVFDDVNIMNAVKSISRIVRNSFACRWGLRYKLQAWFSDSTSVGSIDMVSCMCVVLALT
jgi:hypothetical protein